MQPQRLVEQRRLSRRWAILVGLAVAAFFASLMAVLWIRVQPRSVAIASPPVAQQPKAVRTPIKAMRSMRQGEPFSRSGDPWSFGELRLTIAQIEANPTNSDEDRVDLIILTRSKQGPLTQVLRLIEGDTIFFGAYEIVAEDVQPAPEDGPGKGTAKIYIDLVVTPTPPGPISWFGASAANPSPTR